MEKKLSCGEISAFYIEFEQFMEFYRSLCRFYSKSMWRKICAEKNLYGEKMTKMRSAQALTETKLTIQNITQLLLMPPTRAETKLVTMQCNNRTWFR